MRNFFKNFIIHKKYENQPRVARSYNRFRVVESADDKISGVSKKKAFVLSKSLTNEVFD